MTGSIRRTQESTARRSIAAALLVGMSGLAACGESTTNPAADCPPTANPVPTGTLARNGANFVFTTSDNWVITVKQDAIVIRGGQHPDYVEWWGNAPGSGALVGNHENHNGKHIKDRLGARRSILLPSGALLTVASGGVSEPIQTISIYEGGQSHTIDPRTSTLTHSCAASVSTAVARETAEADGETASIEYKADGGTRYTNEYTQDASGTGVPLGKVYQEQLLGESGGPTNPTNLNDYFDDPRLGNT